MKKIIGFACIVFLLLTLSVPTFAQETVITADVPVSHTVTVISDNGKIIIDGKAVSGKQQIERHKKQSYRIIPQEGKQLDKLLYNGEDVTSQVKNSVYTAPPLVHDAVLIATYKDVPQTPDNRKYDISGRVVDSDGKTLSDVTVEIGGKTVNTDKNGNYDISDVSSGIHYIIITDRDGKIIGSNELLINKADNEKLTVKIDKNGCIVISPCKDTKKISLDLRVEKDGFISAISVKDITENQQSSQTQSNPQPSEGQSSQPSLTPTGDNSNILLFINLLFVSVSALCIFFIFARKKQKVHNDKN